MVVDVGHATAGLLRMLGIPYRFSDTPAAINRPPPTLGADTDHVLAELVGLAPATIAAYRLDGVI